MADPTSYANPDRDIDQALIALKKGTQLIKYSRKGKPKFCPFRLSPDETTLIWYSHGQERNLKLSSVQRIIPGQRTAVFKRYLRPEKEYLSFSLIYNNGERSLDLICKDKAEAEVWLSSLKSLISSSSQARNRRTRSNISDFQDIGSTDSSVHSSRPFGATLEFTSSITRGRNSTNSNPREASPSSFSFRSSDVVGSEHANMQMRTNGVGGGGGEGFRISVSSTPSCSSHSSGPDDIESLGDVYIWGEIWSDGISTDRSGNPLTIKNDVLIPKPLETNVVLDVLQIACGAHHVALVTRQGEIFTWGEEYGGRLGHGIEKDLSRPRLVGFSAVTNVDFAACGQYHTCSVSTSGDLYTWGDGAHNVGLLGHGNDASHWIPKRISGPLEGLQVLSIACGTWHSALATNNGKMFTFGDGTFGVLGHGDRESVTHPKEVESLTGLRAMKVACGLWHTAAIVEVSNQSGGNVPSRKLFTWGDGDKNRLGHGSKDTYLLPTCVSALIDYNFHQIACGSNTTVALTTSGHVFTMGSNAFGQLGNPQVDGKLPCLVQDRLVGEFVEEIACGGFHVAALTSRNEVFTWGRGKNGRLGHGDSDDRNIPTLVEALKDRHVKNIACGSVYTASICIHKWVSGTDQSLCTSCRQPFGFTRKRHKCYNCGLVHCGACSSKKAMKAALAPTPGKPHRVCDSCYTKLKKAAEAGNSSVFGRKATDPRRLLESSRIDRGGQSRTSRLLISPTIEPVKYLEIKSTKPGTKNDYSLARATQVPNLLQLKDIAFPSSLSALQYALKPVVTTPPQPQPQPHQQYQPSSSSRPVSPYARRPSPPRSVTPVFSRGVIDSLKKSNELLNQEVSKLRNQVNNLKQKSQVKDAEIQKLKKNTVEAASLVGEKSTKNNVSMEAINSITTQLKEVIEKLPSEIQECENIKSMPIQVEYFLKSIESPSDSSSITQTEPLDNVNEKGNRIQDHVRVATGVQDISRNGNGPSSLSNAAKDDVAHQLDTEAAQASPRVGRSEGQKEAIEQFEHGVYVTLTQLTDGTKIFKRVRFSKRRFSEQQAEEWWNKNKDRLLRKYNLPKMKNISSSAAESSSATLSAPDENNEMLNRSIC